MDLHQRAAQHNSNTRSSSGTGHEETLRGGFLLLARSAWIAFALVELVLFIGGIFAYATQLHTICTNTVHVTCNFWQPTPGNVQALVHLGIQLPVYAATFLAIDILVSLIFWGVGLLIFWRKSETWIGLFVSLLLVMFGAAGISTTLSIAFQTLYAPPRVTLLLVLLTFIQFSALAAFLLTFPDGRFAPRWSWLVILLWIMQDVFFQLPAPYNVSFWPLPLFAAELLLTWGTTLAIQVFRYVRVYDRMQRQQAKWLLFGLVIVLILNTLYRGVENLVPGWSRLDSLYQLADGTVAGLLFVTIPLCVGIAILRYRLWDIDLIINRTLVYGTLSASVIGMYVLVVVYLGALLRTGNTPAISLVATGIVAVLFQPLRTLLQRAVNRLMYGERHAPYQVLARLDQQLAQALLPEDVLPALVKTIANTLKLPYVAVALIESDTPPLSEERLVAIRGQPPPHTPTERLPLIYQGETVGQLVLAARQGEAQLTHADRQLLEDLARHAGVIAHAVRLTTDLRRSRERLVVAREEERRRLRRDLHDGLGPTLASLMLTLAAAREYLRRDPAMTDALLQELATQVQGAVTDIRRLIYELRPPTLDDLGLIGALRDQAARYVQDGLQIAVDAPSALDPLPAAVEVAAYRIGMEALTNVVRHAQARTCNLTVQRDRNLIITIRDDGCGLPVGPVLGIGMRSMRERAEELGGSCTIEARPEGGTLVVARLPLMEDDHEPSR
jgi:signal transduction histidine kinase